MGEDAPGQVEASAGSKLVGLRARRKRAEQKLYLDLLVPRLEPPVWVRYRPVHQRELDAADESAVESKDPDRMVTANALLLTKACVGVFEIVDGKPTSIDPAGTADPATWPKYDEKLAELLELPGTTPPVHLVRGLYMTDGDIISAAAELGSWSAKSKRRVDEEIEGN